MWLYLYLTVASELVNSSLSCVFLLVASWILWWLADFKNFRNLQVLVGAWVFTLWLSVRITFVHFRSWSFPGRVWPLPNFS